MMITAVKRESGFLFGSARPSATALPILSFHALAERTRVATLVDRLRIKLGFPREVFERAVGPVLERYATFVQLLQAGESTPLSDPDGVFARALERGSCALDYRRGQMLPRGAAPEVIGAHVHRWTYAVFVAALLCDVRGHMANRPGSAQVHLLEELVPASVLEWLAEDPALLHELRAFVAGDAAATAGALGALVLRAARESGSPDRLSPADLDLASPPSAARSTSVAGDVKPALAATDRALGQAPTELLEDSEAAQGKVGENLRIECRGVAPAPESARRFMMWLRQGLADGSLRANQAGALVHFVDEGMLLVSPRIFQAFATRLKQGDAMNAPGEADTGKDIQREILRAGWHVRADKGVNILSYRVMRGDRASARLCGVVIADPARFIDGVYPVNPLLVRSPETRREEA
jgi:hypothetical protein